MSKQRVSSSGSRSVLLQQIDAPAMQRHHRRVGRIEAVLDIHFEEAVLGLRIAAVGAEQVLHGVVIHTVRPEGTRAEREQDLRRSYLASLERDFILKRSFHTELPRVRPIPRFVLKATGSEVALEHSECTPVEAAVQIVMFICFTPLLRAGHRRGGVGGAFVTRRQRFPRCRTLRCRQALTPTLPPAGVARPSFSL
jgi:hypothetical protein